MKQPNGIGTPALRYEVDGAEYVFSAAGSTIAPRPDTTADTHTVGRLVSRFGTAMLPLAAAAAFLAPVDGFRRRELSRFNDSSTSAIDLLWALDGWVYSEERATPQQLLLMRDLLAIRTAEGLLLELSE